MERIDPIHKMGKIIQDINDLPFILFTNGQMVIIIMKDYNNGIFYTLNKGQQENKEFQPLYILGRQVKAENYPSIGNSPFYFYLGSDEFFIDMLQASLQDFKFQFNYLDDKYQLFNVFHYSCHTCDAPLDNNCINCEDNSNRHYLKEQQKCKCNDGYFDISEEKNCKAFEQEYSSIDQKE